MKSKSLISIEFILEKVHNLGIAENTAHNRGATGMKVSVSETEAIDWVKKGRNENAA